MIAWSRTRSPERSVGAPDCRVPKKSPGPRSSRSRSAMTNPSVVSTSAAQPRLALLAQRLLVQQHAGRLVRAAPDAAAQLVQLRQAEPLGVLDDHDAWRSARRCRPRSTVVDTSTCTSPGGERPHHAVLLLRAAAGRAAARARYSGNTSAARWSAISVAARTIDLRRLLHQRIDDVGLAPGVEFAPRRSAYTSSRRDCGLRRRLGSASGPGGSSRITDTSRSP